MPKKKTQKARTARRSLPTRQPPTFITPMAAQIVKELPEGPERLFELKFDEYRALLIKDADRIELRSRKNKDLTGMYPAIALAAKSVNATQAVIDGEIVAFDADGRAGAACASAGCAQHSVSRALRDLARVGRQHRPTAAHISKRSNSETSTGLTR